MRDKRKQPARQLAYKRLSARIDRLEDAISHFHNVINELRRHVSTLDEEVKALSQSQRQGPGLGSGGVAA
jgi:prefoldin subunit 5